MTAKGGEKTDTSFSKSDEIDEKIESDSGSEAEDPSFEGTKFKDLRAEEDQFPGLKRERWWYVVHQAKTALSHPFFRQVWRPRHSPRPPQASLDEAPIVPLAYVSWLSVLTFHVSRSSAYKWYSSLARHDHADARSG